MIKKFAARALLICAAVAAPAISQAQVLDQGNNPGAGPLDASGWAYAQSFTPTLDNLVKVRIYLGLINGATDYSGLVYASLWSQLPNSGNAGFMNAGGTGFQLGSLYAEPDEQWIDIMMSPTALTPSATYWLEFRTDDPGNCTEAFTGLSCNGTASVGFWGTFLDDYAGGSAYYSDTGADAFFNGGDYSNGVYEGVDMAFEEYGAIGAPEPASIVLLATGLVGVLGVAHRRRRKA